MSALDSGRAVRRGGGAALLVPGALLMSAALAGGCSLMGLSDGLEQEGPCGDCSELNFIETPPECMSWQCNTDMDLCELDLVDQDGDDAPTMICALDERAPDCDDQDGANRPGADEVCDGFDNDCDGMADNGLELVRDTIGPAAISGDVTQLSWARRQDVVYAAYRRGTDLVLRAGAAAHPLGVLPAPAGGTALAAAAEDVAVAYVDGSCPAVVVGRWQSAESLEMDSSTASLPKLAGDCPGDTTGVIQPVLALRSDELGLAVWVEQGTGAASCGGVTGTAVARVLKRDVGANWVAPGRPVEIGAHEGPGAPAVLAVDALDFVVATTSGATTQLRRVDITSGRLGNLAVSPLHSEPDCAPFCALPALALTEVEDVAHVRVAYRSGDCSSRGELRTRELRLQGEGLVPVAGESVTVVSDTTLLQVGVAGRPEAPQWAVSWSDETALQVQRLPWPTPISPLTVATVGQAVQPHLLVYDAEVQVSAFDPNPNELFNASLRCPFREPPPR